MARDEERKLRVLLVEPDPARREVTATFLGALGGVTLVALAADAYEAREALVTHKPDAMVMAAVLPRLSASFFAGRVMAYAPLPILVLGREGEMSAEGHAAFTSAGITRFIAMGTGASGAGDEGWECLRESLRALHGEAAARALTRRSPATSASGNLSPLRGRPQTTPARAAVAPCASAAQFNPHAWRHVIAVASSTGGTEALKILLSGFPPDIPPVLVVQHMPSHFTGSYAEQLDHMLPFRVGEAKDGERLQAGRVYLAPGGKHMEVHRRGTAFHVRLGEGPLLHGVRPAADILMASVARVFGPQALGVILTGMGRDGAEGLLAMRRAGAFNVAQDESSSVIFGMPKAAIEIAAVDAVAPLERISAILLKRMRQAA